ncbi:MAG: TauD/TfdA family dioxygenase [Pseudomonadota bacterium]
MIGLSQRPPSTEIPMVALRTADVRATVAAAGVARINAPGLTAHGFADFMETLGEPMFTAGETPVDGLPTLNIVTNVGRTTKPKSVFHSDTSYVARPPSFAGLFAVDVPAKGGATMFVDQYEAYETLPSALKRLLRGATMVHSGAGASQDADAQTRHPVLRRHPQTGRIALYLTTPARCSDLRLADGTDRSDVIEDLFAHSTRQHRRSHVWRPDDVVIWDNRCTLHAADHADVEGNRTLFRALVRGEAPLCATRQTPSETCAPADGGAQTSG